MDSNNFDLKKIGAFIESSGDKAYRKGKAAKDILSIKGQISTCEDLIRRDFSTIGRKYYEMYANDMENANPEFARQMNEITNAKKAIKDLEARIEDIKSNY